MRTSAVTLWEPSFTSPSTAVCEWASMMPGVTCLPFPSTSTAPEGAERFFPTAATRPLTTRTSAFSRIPADPCVHTVAARTTTADGAATGAAKRGGAGRTSVFAAVDAFSGAPSFSFSFGFAPCPGSSRTPSIQISATRLLSAKGSPVSTTRFAIFPGAIVPRRSPRPSWPAGIVVTAASAASAESPRSIASRTRSGKSLASSRPAVVNENWRPASASHFGFDGARS